MRYLPDAIRIEVLKARRSRMPLMTALFFLMMPLVDAFFMIILRDPESARQTGLISAKAQMMAGTADWPTFLEVLAQAISLGGIFLFSIVGSWVFGREFADGTVKDWLAVPVPRGTILAAKFIVVALWSAALALLIYVAAMLLGALLDLPLGTADVLWQGSLLVGVTTCLVVTAMTPVAFFAGIGRGYLLPIGVTLLLVLFANVVAVIGWGSYFPWSVPALYAGAQGSLEEGLPAASYWIVALTGVAGIAGTYLWWRLADQNR